MTRTLALTFMRADQASDQLRRVAPSAIRTARIVPFDDGFKLLATLSGSAGEWTLTSPGGIADTFPSLERLKEFATTLLSGKPVSAPFHVQR